MSKIKKADLLQLVQEQADMVVELAGMVKMNKLSIIKLENEREQPKLKQLTQSVFDGLDEKWRFAAINSDGAAFAFVSEPARHGTFWSNSNRNQLISRSGKGAYDTTDWQNSLIERDTAKELLEVDLSSELTGSELCKAMLARGDKYVMCGVSDVDDSDAANHESDDFLAEAVTDFDCKDELFGTTSMRWNYAVPINNQGEPLTASEFGL